MIPKLATRESWQILPPPDIRVDLGFAESYTLEEFDRIKRGLIPREMEDKWFVFFEEPWLYFHRSWTGVCIYGARFESSANGVSVVESWVSRDTKYFKGTCTDYDRLILSFLIDAFLLGKPATFPVPRDIPSDLPKGLYQHHVVGRGYPEIPYSRRGERSNGEEREE
ncbi:MAG: hypothetical protein HY881_21815 [Deltaproteobacteria bacterium]|nr:hypothetical protein [Deltaproteobacteria bacterium]